MPRSPEGGEQGVPHQEDSLKPPIRFEIYERTHFAPELNMVTEMRFSDLGKIKLVELFLEEFHGKENNQGFNRNSISAKFAKEMNEELRSCYHITPGAMGTRGEDVGRLAFVEFRSKVQRTLDRACQKLYATCKYDSAKTVAILKRITEKAIERFMSLPEEELAKMLGKDAF